MKGELRERARILIIDDQAANATLLQRLFTQVGYVHVHTVTDSSQAMTRFRDLDPDIVLLDLQMPPPDGFELMSMLRASTVNDVYLPILVLTADPHMQAKQRALACGASDFLSKPFDLNEVQLRTRNLLETRFLYNRVRRHRKVLRRRVKERTRDLEQARLEVLDRLSLAAEYRDDFTGEHTRRVGRLSAEVAQAIGQPENLVELLARAAPLHDVGKIGVPDGILLKPERLSPDEFEIMKKHTLIGSRILAGSASKTLQLAEEIALTHHECWDGTGYPHGLAGINIPLTGRIVSVVDVFDALTHDRPYKPAWPREQAIEEISRQSGMKFDAEIVQAFLSVIHAHYRAIEKDVGLESSPSG